MLHGRCVCWSQPWAVLKWSNQSRCCVECGQGYSVGGSSSDVALRCNYCNNLLAAVAILRDWMYAISATIPRCYTAPAAMPNSSQYPCTHFFYRNLCYPNAICNFPDYPFRFLHTFIFCKSLSLFSFFIIGSKYLTCQYILVNYYAFQYILLVNYYAWAHVHASCVFI